MTVEVVPSVIPSSSASAQAAAKRASTHSHIRGLGLRDDGTAIQMEAGFVGQSAAREAAGLVVELVRTKRMAGRALLLAGPPGTGKTAIALAISQELGDKVPFCPLVGSEVFSAEVKKTEVLMESMRKAIGLRIKEVKEVFEGEVVELQPHMLPGSEASTRAISHVILSLRANKGTRTLKMDPSVYESLLRARVTLGDVILIESNSGAVKRLGRCDTHRQQHYDLEADEYVPLPKGEVTKKREMIQEVSLHDLDQANTRPTMAAANDMVSMVGQALLNPTRKTEITEKLRREVDRLVNRFIESGTAELLPGVLFIDEAHMLDLECFTFLNRALESPLAPVLVLATNRQGCDLLVRGTDDVLAPHGIPRELLDRLLIVRTSLYGLDEMLHILGVRARIEGVQAEPAALEELGKVAQTTSLRYVLQLLSPCAVLAQAASRPIISPEDVRNAATLFLDTKRSAAL